MRYLSLLLLITSTSIFGMHHEKLDVIVFAIDLEIIDGQKNSARNFVSRITSSIMGQQPSAIEGRIRSSIRVREWLVAISGGATLAFTAWGLGGVQMWTLHVLLCGGLLTLCSALINVRFSKFPYLNQILLLTKLLTLDFQLQD